MTVISFKDGFVDVKTTRITVTKAQRGRIHRAFLTTPKRNGLYPVEDELVAARSPINRTIGS